MQGIAAFWNRSLLNKLIVMAVPFCLCCVPIGAIGNRGRGAAIPTPTEAVTPHIMGAPTELAEPTAAAAYASGGLGLARSDWETRHGASTREAPGGIFFYGDTLNAMFFNDVAQRIEQSLPDGTTVDAARELAQPLLPSDAQLVETYTTAIGQLVDLYHSSTLAAQLPDDTWINGKPGDHVVVYRRNEGTEIVSGIVIGTGNNP